MKKGYLLIEVLINVFLLCLILGSMMMVFYAGNLSWHTENTGLELQQQVRLSMEKMVRQLREATNIVVTDNGDSDSVQFDSFTESDLIYSRDAANNTFVLTHSDLSQEIIAKDISSLNFGWVHDDGSYDSMRSTSNVFQIMVTGSRDVRGKTLSFSWIEKVKLRNE